MKMPNLDYGMLSRLLSINIFVLEASNLRAEVCPISTSSLAPWRLRHNVASTFSLEPEKSCQASSTYIAMQ